jgi:molybdate transport system regulatory protein
MKSGLRLRVRLHCGDEIAMGPGKADLLQAIDREGSISAAGKSLQMSYRRTWLLVDAMNRCWKSRLVETTPGGGARKGARLTVSGRRVLDSYRQLQSELEAAASQGVYPGLGALLRKTPLPHQP